MKFLNLRLFCDNLNVSQTSKFSPKLKYKAKIEILTENQKNLFLSTESLEDPFIASLQLVFVQFVFGFKAEKLKLKLI